MSLSSRKSTLETIYGSKKLILKVKLKQSNKHMHAQVLIIYYFLSLQKIAA